MYPSSMAIRSQELVDLHMHWYLDKCMRLILHNEQKTALDRGVASSVPFRDSGAAKCPLPPKLVRHIAVIQLHRCIDGRLEREELGAHGYTKAAISTAPCLKHMMENVWFQRNQ
jgi:hypothetical protein